MSVRHRVNLDHRLQEHRRDLSHQFRGDKCSQKQRGQVVEMGSCTSRQFRLLSNRNSVVPLSNILQNRQLGHQNKGETLSVSTDCENRRVEK